MIALADPADWTLGITAWKEGFPWLTPGAVRALEGVRGDRALEFGCGGSTIWLAHRFREVFSFESSQLWISRVLDRLRKENIANVRLYNLLGARHFKEDGFDLILVDSDGNSTDREHISRSFVGRLNPGGVFVLDNYARYPRKFLNESEWKIRCFDDPSWDGRGTLVATRKQTHENDRSLELR